MLLFYQPDITEPLHTLDKEESGHCIRVLRMKQGDKLHLTDGKGMVCEARIADGNPKSCVVEILHADRQQARAPYRTHLAVAPTKNISRFEWFLEKATEIGVDEITPLICENSERRNVKTDRLNKVLISAMKQSLKAFLPLLNEPVRYDAFIQGAYPGQKFIAYISSDYSSLLRDNYQRGSSAVVLIGPEGDFTPAEVTEGTGRGFQPVSLGHSRLRTETAGVAACHTIQLIND